MSAVDTTNRACCSIPVVQVDYTAQGVYKPHGAFDRVYVTGDNSETALIVVYDAFGYFPQTLQGADILAKSVGAQVFMPDFFGEGNACSTEKVPPKNDEDRKYFQEFMEGPGNFPASVPRLVAFADVLKAEGFKKIGALGYCWGGKVVLMGASNESSPLDAISVVHPSRFSAQDVEGLTVPLGLYSSNGESREEFDKASDLLSKKPFSAKVDCKYYSNMFHGWAAARANLSDPDNKREYEDVYSRAAALFRNAFA
ncbi:dienelactone hydrolase [Thelephora terrestris]|uniref:Dienelactone hydrolase n=1 Tax=Thelephora terrestris TaxID=56493 RepID=A0A9P6H7C4_9AGAM|nr:dienelactone hydrolase [Thelephora terrestris]